MHVQYLNPKYADIVTDKARAAELGREMLQKGYVALPQFLNGDARAKLHALIADRSRAWDKNEKLKGTIAYDIAYSDEVVALSQALYDARCRITGETPVQIKKEQQVVGLPYKKSDDEKENTETAYHYDATYVNYLLPLVMPPDPGDDNGNLVMFPNLRTKPWPKVCIKLFSRLLRHSRMARKWYGYVNVHYDIDTMYIFFGDLSFHGVNPIKNGERFVMTVNSHW